VRDEECGMRSEGEERRREEKRGEERTVRRNQDRPKIGS
jgi:hypothetical protein